jgi:hypothetical protein
MFGGSRSNDRREIDDQSRDAVEGVTVPWLRSLWVLLLSYCLLISLLGIRVCALITRDAYWENSTARDKKSGIWLPVMKGGGSPSDNAAIQIIGSAPRSLLAKAING